MRLLLYAIVLVRAKTDIAAFFCSPVHRHPCRGKSFINALNAPIQNQQGPVDRGMLGNWMSDGRPADISAADGLVLIN